MTTTEIQPVADEVDTQALRAFEQRYAHVTFAPVVIVIAAYGEEHGIGHVVDRIPARSCGLDVQTLVVDDGSPDRTAEVAGAHGAFVCRAPRNRGQGAALRLGYQLARQRGARYIVTTDADGQYDIGELPLLLQPLLDDTADFVTGSRVLGSREATDLARRVGTPVFAALVSVLTGAKVTDTSFGFRAMRAEVAGAVTLTQPQYQSSELLIGVLARGYRVLEQPMRMLKRNQGSTKKGGSVVYGWNYLRVVVGTWWRERDRNSRSSSTKRAAKSTA